MIWVRIAGAPPRQLYKNADALPYLTAGEAREQLLESVGVLHSAIDGETPNMTIALRNDDGRCARLFAYPPIGQQVDVFDETGLVFSGVAKTYSPTSITVQSAQNTPLPLRTSVVWGGYREEIVLAHRYGYAAGALTQYDQARTQFVWCDHASFSVDDVLQQDGQSVSNWTWKNAVDSAGHPITMVVFDRPVDEGLTMIARGRGKRDPVTGSLMENPADVVLDILAGIAGRPVTAAQMEPFRRACGREGIVIGGSIAKADSAKDVIVSIMASIGGGYSDDMPGLCRLWPGVAGAASRLRLTEGDVSISSDIDDLKNQLAISFGYEGDTPRSSVVLSAPDSIARHGLRPDTLQARWIVSARVAAAVGTRLLQQRARPVYVVSGSTRQRLSLGDTVTLAHPALPVQGDEIVQSREVDFDAGTTAFTCRIAVGALPRVRLVSQSSAYDPTQYANGTIVTQGGSRVITLIDENGQPIANAQVTLDGGTQIRQSDPGGHVSFPVDSMPPGIHQLHIVMLDGRVLNLPIEVT